jgi:hypothetical protein
MYSEKLALSIQIKRRRKRRGIASVHKTSKREELDDDQKLTLKFENSGAIG